MSRKSAAIAMIVALMSFAACGEGRLEERVAELEARATRLEDANAIRKLAFAYGYYMDNAMTEQVVALLSPDAEFCEISGYGRYDGFDGCRKIWDEILAPGLKGVDGGLKFGRLIKHYLVKDVIDVDPSGDTATGRFDYIGYSGIYGAPERTTQQIGVYRMSFRKTDGVWRISRFQLSFDTSDWNYSTWATDTRIRCPKAGAPAPDGPPSLAHPFPENAVAPFDFPNPVTGEAVPDYVNPQRHWQGNWPGEFGGPCGRLPREEQGSQ